MEKIINYNKIIVKCSNSFKKIKFSQFNEKINKKIINTK